MWQQQKKCSTEDDDSLVAGCRHGFDSNQAAYEQAALKHTSVEQTMGEQTRCHDEYADDIALFRRLKQSLGGYFLLSVYLALLIIPVYAIVMSAIKHNWLMMVIDIMKSLYVC